MEKNKDNFSPEEIKKMAQTQQAQQLMSMLGSQQAENVRQNLRSGNMADVQKALQTFLADPQAQALLKQLEEGHG